MHISKHYVLERKRDARAAVDLPIAPTTSLHCNPAANKSEVSTKRPVAKLHNEQIKQCALSTGSVVTNKRTAEALRSKEAGVVVANLLPTSQNSSSPMSPMAHKAPPADLTDLMGLAGGPNSKNVRRTLQALSC